MHVDKASGAKASRPKLKLVLKLLREGDTLKVTRLSRSVLHLVTLGADLRERGIGLHVIEQGIDTTTMAGRAMSGMLSVLAELQRELIVANTNDGLASARARGRVGGRRPKLTSDQAALAQRFYDEREKTVQQIADMFGVPRSTVYGHLDKIKTVPCKPDPADIQLVQHAATIARHKTRSDHRRITNSCRGGDWCWPRPVSARCRSTRRGLRPRAPQLNSDVSLQDMPKWLQRRLHTGKS
ncbi:MULTISPECIES: recombinase family protein [Streptomyces]|uniref:recombinase family protein n=1 Tax=Streptomyces TaxID=1883 RepID=UPI001E61B4D1|nr:recombinase family protein [Streptomyces chartreusis]